MIRVSHAMHCLGYLGMTPGEISIWCQQPPDPIPADLDTIKWRMKLWTVDARDARGIIRSVYSTIQRDMEERRETRRAEVLFRLDCIYAEAMSEGDLRAALWVLREQSRICGLHRPEQVRHTIPDMDPSELVEVLGQNVVALLDYCERNELPIPQSVRGLLVAGPSEELSPDDFAMPIDR